jgi:lipopolysaccharide export system permease protein
LVNFLITLIAFTSILLTVRMLQFAALIINKGVAFHQIATVFIAIIPTFLEIALPMATLLGVMLAIARLSGDSEIIIIRASGISLLQLAKPILIFGLLITIFNYYVSIVLRPWGNFKVAESLFEIARSKTTAGLTPGVFNRIGSITLYAEEINDKTGQINKVLIDDKRDENSRRIIVARNGRLISDTLNRSLILALENGDIHEESKENYVLTHFTTNNFVVDFDELYKNADLGHDKKTRELYLHEIKEKIGSLEYALSQIRETDGDNKLLSEEIRKIFHNQEIPTTKELKRQIRKLKTEAGSRFSMPFATLFLALLGMPLGLVPPRTQKTWGAGLSVVLGLLVFTVYYVLLSIGITLGENGKIDYQLGLWMPNIIAVLLTIFVMYKITTEKWYSIAHGFELLTNKTSKIFSKQKV